MTSQAGFAKPFHAGMLFPPHAYAITFLKRMGQLPKPFGGHSDVIIGKRNDLTCAVRNAGIPSVTKTLSWLEHVLVTCKEQQR